MFRTTAIFLGLTILTQIGGLAFLVARFSRHPWLAFLPCYAALTVVAMTSAPFFGRMALPCFGSALAAQTPLYCALNRHYVTPEMFQVISDLSQDIDRAHPGTQTRYLDGGFPFLDGFPMLPHLSHDDGEKLDLSFYWQDAKGGYLPGYSRFWLGFWGYDAPRAGETAPCPKRLADLRWDFDWLNARLPDWTSDTERMRYALNWMDRDDRVGKVLIEPHLKARFAPDAAKLRFQGCRAARHDDHIHFQL